MLEELLGSESVNWHQLQELTTLFDVPERPKALSNVLAVALRISQISGFEGFPSEKIQELEPLCATIKQAIESAPEDRRLLLHANETSFKKSLQGLLTKAPLYSLLFFSLSGSAGATLRRLQQAGLVMWESPHLGTQRRQTLYRYQLAIRMILESRLGTNWLANSNPAALCSLRAVREWFVEMENGICYHARYSENIEFQERKLGLEISKFARTAFHAIDAARGAKTLGQSNQRRVKKLMRRRPWNVRGPQYLGGDTWMDCCVPATGDHINPETPIYLVRRQPDDAAELRVLDTLDIHPAELEPAEEFLLSDSDTLPFYAREFKNRMRLRGMAQRIETHNQFLPFSLQQFTQRELQQLFDALDDVSTDKKHGTEKLITAVMFATSSWFGRAQNLTVLAPGQKLVRGESEILYFDPLTSTWLIPAISPEYRTPTDLAAEESSRWVRSDFVELPDRFGFERMLRRMLGCSLGCSLFKSMKNLEARTKRFLKSISPRHTLERVERSLLYRTAGMYEPVQASYLFGNPITSASSRMFYTSLSLQHYRKLYATVCQTILETLGRENLPCKKPSDYKEGFIGARYCPTSDALRDVFEFLGARVEASRKNVGIESGAWIDLHNWFTINCSAVQAVLIGARGINEPLLSPSQINPDGLAVFRDKDGADQFHTRSIQLHPMALEVTNLYHLHRRKTLIRLALINQRSYSILALQGAPWSFLLDYGGELVEVRPSTISRYLSAATTLPFNCFRKYLRTCLTELEVSPTAIDALLGHASYGEQAWGHFSTLDWGELYREQKRALDLIIQELGLELRSGLAS